MSIWNRNSLLHILETKCSFQYVNYSSLKNGTNRNQSIEKTVPNVKGSSCPYEIGTVMFRQESK